MVGADALDADSADPHAAEGVDMTFIILLVWSITSVLAGVFEKISTADMYIGMTILLAAIYIEQVNKKGG